MPYEGPGERYSVVATKATAHGKPAVEYKHAGIAAKSTQAAPITDPTNAGLVTAAKAILVGEEFVIQMDGIHEVAVADCPGGAAAAGDQLWIVSADNTLANAAAAGRIKFGLVSEVDTARGVARVNLEQRSSF